MTTVRPTPLVTRRLLGPRTLVYFYRRRLRAHGVQELLAGVGVALAVAVVLVAGVTQGSIAGSTRQALRVVTGSANLQLQARGPLGFPETLLGRVERIPGVRHAAPLLERSMRVVGPHGSSTNVYVAGTDTSLAVLNGLGRTLPLNTLKEDAIGLSATAARAIGLPGATEQPGRSVEVLVGGRSVALAVSTVLGREYVGPLASALVGVMPLQSMQTLLGQPRLVTRILVQAAPGRLAAVRRRLSALAGGRLLVAGPEQEVAELRQALSPSRQANELFAVVGALLGFLLAFAAVLLTVPERRQAIADLRLAGTRRSAIVQLALFQALCLVLASALVGLAVGYALARWAFQASTAYLAEAFTLGGGTVLSARDVLVALGGGVAVTLASCAVPLLDLRPGLARDAIYVHPGEPGNTLGARGRLRLSLAALVLVAVATVLYLTAPAQALLASIALALATVLAVPAAFAAALAGARALSARAPRLATLALALSGVRGTTVRALALSATGAVALFAGVALGGARADLLDGIRAFAHSYAADAPIWVGEPGDNQATGQLVVGGAAARIARVPGVAAVARFQGGFLALGARRVWVIARPPGGADEVLASQTLGGATAARRAQAHLARGGWIVVSQQIAAERHARVGGTLTLPTPTGPITFRVAALSTNLAWIPGVVFMGTRDFAHAWGTVAPSALAVHPAPGVAVGPLRTRIERALGRHSGLEVASAASREARIDALTGEGLGQLGTISTLLLVAALAALVAALTSSIHKRRRALAGLRLAGAPPTRLRRILLVEALLMLGTGCLTGALAGIYGQFAIDAYLRHVTGFPVVGAAAGVRPFAIFALVLAVALAASYVPSWFASRVPPALALAEE